MKRPTGSKMPLVMRCPASMALPWIDDPPGDRAIRGVIIHAFQQGIAEARIALGDAATTEDLVRWALEDAPVEYHMYLRSLDQDALAEYTELLPEVAIAYDWRARTARYLGTGLDRAYGELAPTETPFTTDLLGVSPDRVRVSDYKTGRTNYGPAREFAQLQLGALGAARLYGRDAALVELVYLDEQGDPRVNRGELDGWDLDAFAVDVERTMDRLGEAQRAVAAGQPPEVSPGPHCREMHCPAYRNCPSTSALVRHLPANVAAFQGANYLVPVNLAKTWHAVQGMQHALGIIEQEVRNLSFREAIDLGDGTVLGPRERKVETMDGPVAHGVLAGMLGKEYADKAVTVETTKAAIGEAAKIYRDRNPKDADGKRVVLEAKNATGLLDRIFAEIRARGGASVKITNNPTVYKRPKEIT